MPGKMSERGLDFLFDKLTTGKNAASCGNMETSRSTDFRRSAGFRRRSFFVFQSELLSIRQSVSVPASYLPARVLSQATRPFLFPRLFPESQQRLTPSLRAYSSRCQVPL